MLMLIGAVRFEVQPFNATEYTHSTSASHVEKPVMGAAPLLEFTGGGPESWTIRAILFPDEFGGEASLTVLSVMREMGLPQWMMRGDGLLMGWVVIDSVTERSTYLNAGGTGKIIEVDISLRRSAGPSAGGFFSAVSGLFNGLF